MKKNIFFLSKDRWGSDTLRKQVEALYKNNQITIFVEPNQLDEYTEALSKYGVSFICHKDNNLGNSYAQYNAYTTGLKSREDFFILDDDTITIMEMQGEKQVNLGIEKLDEALDYLATSHYYLTSLCFKHLQWCVKEDFKPFGRIGCVIFLNNKVLSNDIRNELIERLSDYNYMAYRLYEDVFISGLFLVLGLQTGICYRYSFQSTPMTKNPGGCSDDYKNNQQRLCAEELYKIFGCGFSQVINNKGRTEIKIQWKKLFEARYKDKNQKKLF